jgi:hypothetical protein
MLDHFRIVRVPAAAAEHQALQRHHAADHTIGVVFDLADIVACRVGALGEARWRNYLAKHAKATPPPAPPAPADATPGRG